MTTSAIHLQSPAPPHALRGDEPFFIVINASAGEGGDSDPAEQISAILASAGRRHQVVAASKGSEIPAAARRAVELATAAGGIVVACGGDGTLSAVCQVALGTGLPIGLVPRGTFNYFARTHGIPEDLDEATRLLLDATLRPVQVGMVNDQVFLVNASLGLYPTLLEEREDFKQRYGRSRLVALGAALVTLMKAHRQLNVQVTHGAEKQQLRTPSLVVDNNALQLRQIGIPDPEALEHGQLVAIMSRPMGTLALYGLLLRGLLSRLGEADQITSFPFRDMTVQVGRGRRSVKVASDGEIFWLKSPLKFRPSEHLLPLLVARAAPQGAP